MFAKWFTLTATVSLSVGILVQAGVAIAAAPLTDARVKAVVNQVLVALKNQPIRDAHLEDRLTPGEWLSTKRSSRADLRFNDGTFARVGELSTFGFRPNQRYYDLRQGTFLFVIPPNKGGSTFHTPNVTAGVRGSALFIRYIEEDGITIVGALTNNPAGPMEITNQDGSQTQDLRAGQLAVVQKDKIIGIYEFDLRTFYNTSNLVEGLDLQGDHGKSADPDIALVQAETTQALKEQSPFQGDAMAGTPDFFKNPDHRLAANSEPYGLPNQLVPSGLSNLSTAIPAVIDSYFGRPIVPTQTQPIPAQPVSLPTLPGTSSQLPTPRAENPSLGSMLGTTPATNPQQPSVFTPVTPTPPAAITTPPTAPQLPNPGLPATPATPPIVPQQPPVLTPVTPTPPAAITTPPTAPQLPNPGLPATPATPPTVPQQPPVLTPVTPTPPAAITTPPTAPQLPNPGLPATPATPALPNPGLPATPATPATPAAPATTTQQPNPGLQTTPTSPTTPPATN